MKLRNAALLLLFPNLVLTWVQVATPPLQAQQKTAQTKTSPHQTSPHQATTYCNPLNLDYTYKITESDKDISYRSGADPAVVSFRGDYYMFVTRALGY